jgi:tetratricopeptide (TPR) repeat protein
MTKLLPCNDNNEPQKPSEEDLERLYEEWDAIDTQGIEFEQEEEYDQALECYEQVLLARSHYLGEHHIEVAKSLINTGRVMELQGNTEGSLDLYRVAHAIYSGKVTSHEFRVVQEDAATILKLVPGWMEQGRYQEAVAFLTKCLEAEHDDRKNGKIHLELGRAYLGLRDYTAATVCIVEAAKNDGEEEDIFSLLQQVEFLQREPAEAWSNSSASSHSSTTASKQGEPDGFILDGMSDIVDDSPLEASITQEEKGPDSNGSRSAERKRSDEPLSSSCSESNLFSQVDDDDAPFDESPVSTVHPVSNEKDLLHVSRGIISRERGLRVSIPEPEEDLEAPLVTSPQRSPDSKKAPGGSSTSRKPRIPSPRRKKDASPSPRKKNFGSDRSKIARTLSDQFRRPRRAGFASLPEEKEAYMEEIPQDVSPDQHSEETSLEGPIQYIDTRSKSWESAVSQITFVLEDPKMARSSNNSGWWWGVTAEGFGRWFPTNIVSPAVQAAEGFLSAKAIHSKARPEPLDFVSDDESSDEEDETQSPERASNMMNVSSVAVPMEHHGSAAKEVLRSPRRGNFAVPMPSSPRAQEQNEKAIVSDIVDFSALLAKQLEDLGKSHPSVATTRFTLAVLQSRNGSAVLATESAIEALHIQNAAGNLQDATRSLHFLADLHLHQKQYKASLRYYAECLDIEKNVFGYHSEEIAKTLNCIGNVQSLENEFALAVKSHQEALQILKECHGENLKHPLVSETLCQIGAVYYRERNSPSALQSKTGDYDTFIETGMLEVIGRAHEDRGSYKMAISFFEEKLQFLKNRDDDVETPEEVAATLNSLGMLCSRAGLYTAAIEYYETALNIQNEIGCDEIYEATSRVLTATAEFHMGNWLKALIMLLDAHAVLDEKLGSEHQTVAATLYQIGVVQSALCDVDEAIGSFEEAKSIQTRLLGEEHPATLRTRRQINDLFAVYEAEVDSALQEFNDILETQCRIHGTKHPNIAETLQSIGIAQSRKGASSQALRTLEECYYMRVEFLGLDHPLHGATLHEIAKIHLNAGRVKKSLHICEVVLGIRKEALGEGHVDVSRTLTTKGSCLVAQGNFVAGKNYFKEALMRLKLVVGDRHPAVADVYVEMGTMHLRQCQFEEARAEIKHAVELYRGSLEEDHPGIQDALGKLDRVDHDEMLYV